MTNKQTSDSGKKFLSHERRELIAVAVDEQGAVRVRELTWRFGVSDMTIRRDIEALAAMNRLVRVHGGATRVDRAPRSVDEPGFQAKLTRERDEKAAIAAAAAALIAPGTAIGITAGTTTFQLTQHLLTVANLTVVTNSIPVASALSSAASNNLQVVITGGTLTRSNAIVGPLADSSLGGLHLDQLFMGVHGVDEVSGFTTPNLTEARTNQSFIQAAREVVIVADSTKWGLTGLGSIAPLSAASVLITDDGLGQEVRHVLEREISTVTVVPAG